MITERLPTFLRGEPPRKPPDAAFLVRQRRRQYKPMIKALEHSRSSSCFGRQVDPIRVPKVMNRMRMAPAPLGNGIGSRIQHLPDLKPPEQHVEVWRIRLILILTVSPLDTTKPSEEQENVPNTDIVRFKMSLRLSALAKHRVPTSDPSNRVMSHIRIEVGSLAGPNTISR